MGRLILVPLPRVREAEPAGVGLGVGSSPSCVVCGAPAVTDVWVPTDDPERVGDRDGLTASLCTECVAEWSASR
jgi:hypothetical protein